VFHPKYEPLVTAVLSRLLSKGDVFVDVGAHVGRYTLLASRKVGPRGIVVAIEPVPENYFALIENIRRNKINNIVALPIAAWSTTTTLEFIVPPGRSEATAKERHHFSGLQLRGYKIQVKAVDLDTLLLKVLKLSKVDAMKIDVEGAEIEVLEGAREVLKRFRPKLVIEVRPNTYPRIRGILEYLGYDIVMIDESTILAL